MSEIKRIETDEYWADSTIIQAGDTVYVGYCMGNEGGTIEQQIDIIKRRFGGKYPTRKAYTTDFIRDGILFQIDAVAHAEKQ